MRFGYAGAMLALTAVSAEAAVPDAAVLKFLPLEAEIETRLDGDVTGDGIEDIVAVGRNDDERKLVVLAGGARGLTRIGQTNLDASPLGSAELRVARGVLLVQDLTGGTTAIASIYRWRFDPVVRKMQLIGDDVSLYSRTWMHDGTDVSTNRLTGVQVKTAQKLKGGNGNVVYVPGKPFRKAVSRKPIYMGDETSPSETLGWGD